MMKINKPLTSALHVVAEGSSRPRPAFLATLGVGDRIRAEVLELLADGRAVLDVRGNKIVARSMVDFTVGAKVLLEVREAGDLPRLVRLFIEPGHDQVTTMVATLARVQSLPAADIDPSALAGLSPFGRLIVSLATIFSRQAPDPELVHLISLLSGLASPPSPKSGRQHSSDTGFATGGSMEAIKVLLDMTEAHQSFNAGQDVTENGGFLMFPCLMARKHGWGEWFFSWDHGAEEEGYKLKFFLEMTRLGPLALSLSCHDQQLHGVFRLSNPQAVSFVKEHLPLLETTFLEKGFTRCSFICRHDSVHVLQEIKDMAGHVGENQFALVDMKV